MLKSKVHGELAESYATRAESACAFLAACDPASPVNVRAVRSTTPHSSPPPCETCPRSSSVVKRSPAQNHSERHAPKRRFRPLNAGGGGFIDRRRPMVELSSTALRARDAARRALHHRLTTARMHSHPLFSPPPRPHRSSVTIAPLSRPAPVPRPSPRRFIREKAPTHTSARVMPRGRRSRSHPATSTQGARASSLASPSRHSPSPHRARIERTRRQVDVPVGAGHRRRRGRLPDVRVTTGANDLILGAHEVETPRIESNRAKFVVSSGRTGRGRARW